MKLTTFIMIIALAQVYAKGFGQKINLNVTNTPIEKVLQTIRQQSGYEFIYNVDDLKGQKVTLKLNNTSVEDALDASLKNLDITYNIRENNIVLKKKDPTFLERLAERWASIDVVGRVVDMEGKPLPGATVKVKATGKGVSTDGKGNFHLKNVEEAAVLVVSYTGYISREMSASANMGSIVLEVSLSKLDEVQVIAYGTTTQRLSTGNVTTIKADVIEKQPVNNPLLALQGRVPGLFIEQATGFAGTGVKVRIQGQNSLNYGNDPLYVIDGIPFSSQLLPGGNQIIGGSGGTGDSGSSFGNPLSYINPSDIESIDVLKDADATAIYGSRAANGAILITTKKGKAGDTKITLNLQSGWAEVTHKLDLMDGQQYLQMRREALRNDGLLTPTLGPYGENDLNGNWDNTRYTDWQKELIGKKASYQDLNASVSGGSDRMNFLIGAGYHRETNVFPGNFSDNKASVHFNINNTSTNQKFKIQFSGGYLSDNNQMPNIDLTAAAMSLAPVAPALYTSSGGVNWGTDASGRSTFANNPIGYLYNYFNDKTANLISSAVLSYQIVNCLELKCMFGYGNLQTTSIKKNFLNSVPPELLTRRTRSTVFTNNNIQNLSIEPQLSYHINIDKGKLEILLGTTFQQNSSNGVRLTGGGFSSDLVMNDLTSAATILVGPNSNTIYKYNALFSRINYNWQDKYILNLTARRDGSSRFGYENQFHDFAAIAGAWVFSKEKLIVSNLPFLSFGKIRGSYGNTGSDQIPDYQFLSLLNPLSTERPYQGIPLYQATRLTNPYLQWEATKKLQFGLDLGFFKDRVLLNSNYYVNHSSNQLSDYTLPATAGFSSILRNQEFKIRNSGWEFMLSSINLNSSSFNWSTSLNLTISKSILADYPNIEQSSSAKTKVIGKPLNIILVYHFLGVDPATGQYLFEDKDGNPTTNPSDQNVILDLSPKFYGGFQNTFRYKSLQIDVLFSFAKQIAQNVDFGLSNIVPGNFNSGIGNQLTSLLGRWQRPGDISYIQRFSSVGDLSDALYKTQNSDAAWSDATYVRLKNISLGWQMPENWVRKIGLKTCNLFIQGQNLWTITNYTGLDPETKSSSSLPPLRAITLGIKANL